MDDPLYGIHPDPKAKGDYGYNLGAMAARGERGALIVDPDFLTRLPSNPFFPYLLERIDGEINRPSGPSDDIATTASPELPVRFEALLSTQLPEDEGLQPFAGH